MEKLNKEKALARAAETSDLTGTDLSGLDLSKTN